MVDDSKRTQEDWDRYHKERQRRREEILKELLSEIEKDKLLFEEKRKELSTLEHYLEFAPSGNIKDGVIEKKKEIKEIKHRIATNREIHMVMDNKGPPDRVSFLDFILDRLSESSEAIGDGSMIDALPFRGAALLGILEIRELFKKWMGKRGS